VPKLLRIQTCRLFFAHTSDIHQTRTKISSATLDLEPRHLTFLIPDIYALGIDLTLSGASLGQELLRLGVGAQGTESVLMLKRAREFDVDRARTKWCVKDKCLVIVV
jgi:hypothetical protein